MMCALACVADLSTTRAFQTGNGHMGPQSVRFTGTMHPTCTCLLLFLLLSSVECGGNSTETCEALYENGVQAYLENRFVDCVQLLEQAAERYRIYAKKVSTCRLKCHDEAALSEPLYHVNVEQLRFYENAIKHTLCVIKCRNEDKHVFGEFNLSEDAVSTFEARTPYEYLHVCYAQMGDMQKAASAAFTYLVTNPNDDMMAKNLKYYLEQPGATPKNVVNFEAHDFVFLHMHGSEAYNSENWQDVIDNMEESLLSYLQAEDECRAQCEGPFDQGWLPDFIPSIANHFAYCLRCKRKCKEKLSTLNGDKNDDLYPSHYHYLQYAYYKVGNLKAACQAAASYLLFYPFDEGMLYNIEYYRKKPKVNEEYFKPRPEAVIYVHRNNYEENLFKYIFKVFTEQQNSPKYSGLCGLNGGKRFVVDGFVGREDCRRLVDIARRFSIAGDGYSTSHPHTQAEYFEGLSLGRAGSLDRESLELLLRTSDRVKLGVVKALKVRRRVHFAFTHLVCRSAVAGLQGNRTDLSHAVHGDNCNLLEDGRCVRERPAFTWRDFTALLYLNEDFGGGDLFFVDPGGKEVVKPMCGRLVGFTSGGENLHGVGAVKWGTRCALAIWLTYQERKFEPERKKLVATVFG